MLVRPATSINSAILAPAFANFIVEKAITHLLMKDIEKSNVEKFFYQHIRNNGTLFNFIANNSEEMLR